MRFSKMHGIGNDFVLVDARRSPLALRPAQIRALADRHTGIGCDQLLSVEAPRDPSCAFYYGIWNADGSPSGQCGNGVRCVAAWLHRAGVLAPDEAVRIESPSGPVMVRVLDAQRVTVDMGEPVFDPARVPLLAGGPSGSYPLTLEDGTVHVGAVSMGNPHAVLLVQDLADAALERLGPQLTGHPHFPQGANAGFVRILDRNHLQLRVHERGAGWTQACGTGACAAMAVLRARGQVDERVQVDLPGGRLQIDWPGSGHTLWMTGPAAFAFEGEWLPRE
ncbi:diaminopimelate epimerase [Frateuria sp.]|uniref:diaminopimelate epimerase n=1 Tax=Frateuria sp. TaxID=2211372 RepID=UPI0017A0B270|nr:diaminopimelate epimerase [Frateuria sp.]NUR22688.1 diaminopimelate epimerase [Frateuria sp.]